MRTIRPLRDRVLVRRLSKKDRLSSGLLVLPDQAQEESDRGVVLAKGPGGEGPEEERADGSKFRRFFGTDDVNVGDTIVFSKYYLAEPGYSRSEDLAFVRAWDVMGVEEP